MYDGISDLLLFKYYVVFTLWNNWFYNKYIQYT